MIPLNQDRNMVYIRSYLNERFLRCSLGASRTRR